MGITSQPGVYRYILLGCVLMMGCVVGSDKSTEEDLTGPAPDPIDVSSSLDVTPSISDATSGGDPVDVTVSEVAEDAGPPPECTPETDWKCDDWEACTDDACVDGTCVHTAVVGCCSADEDCDDGIPCTYDECNLVKSECLHPFESNTCCITAADCGGGSSCSSVLCAAHQCTYPVTSADGSCGCTNKIDCDDSNPCTSDSCVDGACVYALVGGEGCCTSETDCDDGDAVTEDQCQQGRCWNGGGTCEADDPCQGPGFCSTGTCDGGVCTYPLDCCELDADCDDGLQVTTDRCSAHICVHDFGEETPCVTDANCSPQGPCTVGICLTDVGVCSWSATGLDDGTCCGQDVDCAPSGECVVSSCEAMTCVESPTSGTAPFWSATWPEGTLEGWVASGDGKDAKWQTTDVQAISSPYSLYYGRLPELDYDVGVTSGSVISPVITPPAGASGLTLRFWRSANIEPLVSSDKLHLELVTEGEESPVLWDKNDDGGPGLGWKEEVVDLQGLVSGPFQLRFVFDSVDDVNNSGMGVLVDDLEVLQDCAGNTP